jgi:hypothetical protein
VVVVKRWQKEKGTQTNLVLNKHNYCSPATALESLLGIFNARREIRKRTDTDVAFAREYSRVSISAGNVKCTRESRSSKDKDKRRKIYIFLAGREELS